MDTEVVPIVCHYKWRTADTEHFISRDGISGLKGRYIYNFSFTFNYMTDINAASL